MTDFTALQTCFDAHGKYAVMAHDWRGTVYAPALELIAGAYLDRANKILDGESNKS